MYRKRNAAEGGVGRYDKAVAVGEGEGRFDHPGRPHLCSGIHLMPVFSWVLRYPAKLINSAPAEDKTEIFIFARTFQLSCN